MNDIFERQKSFQRLIEQPTAFVTDHDRAKASNIQLRRAQDELAEAIREIPFDLSNFGATKKRISSFPKDRVKDELVDTFLFMINGMNILGITPKEFLEHCELKQRININRFHGKQRFINKPDDYLIVIEGPDGVGKSSICDELSLQLGFPIMRMPDVNDKKFIEEYSTFYRRTIKDVPGIMILDRFYPSSLVYGNYFGREMDVADITELHKNRHVFVFVIDRDEPFRGDTFIEPKDWPEIRTSYLNLSITYQWKVIKNNTSLENCVKEIVENLQF